MFKYPEKPVIKKYKITALKTMEEFKAAVEECVENKIFSFDYETGPKKATKDRMYLIKDFLNKKIKEIEDDYSIHIAMAKNLSQKKAAMTLKNKKLKELDKAVDEKFNAISKSPLDPNLSYPCVISFCHSYNNCYIMYISEDTLEEVFKILNDKIFTVNNVVKIAFNMSFESKFSIANKGYLLPPLLDPLIIAVRCLQVIDPDSILDPKRPSSGKGLKEMAKKYLGVEMGHFEDLLKNKKVTFFNDIPAYDEDAMKYAAEDSIFSMYLAEYWVGIAEAIIIDSPNSPYKNYLKWLKNIEIPFSCVIGQMEYHGMSWNDEQYIKTYEYALQQQQINSQQITDLCNEICNKLIEKGIPEDLLNQFKDINPGKTGKTNQLKTFIFEILNVPVAKRSDKTDAVSMDSESLMDCIFMLENNLLDLDEEKYLGTILPEDFNKLNSHQIKIYDVLNREPHPFKEECLKLLNLIVNTGKYSTLISSHLEGRRKYLNPVTGRIHCSYTPWTETSRTNSSKPNGQNVPRYENDFFNIRSLYRAAENKVLILIDYSGFELRLMAWKSNDENMLSILNNDGDIHTATAMVMTNKKAEDVTKIERSLAKAGNFGINYGGTEYALRRTLKDMGIRKSLHECDQIVKAITKSYPGIPVYQKNIALQAAKKGYVETIFGYKRLLPNINSRRRDYRSADERKAANTPIQGSAADIVKRAQNLIYEYISRYKLHGKVDQIAQIHDEIILEVDKDKNFVKDIVKDIVEIMENKVLYGVKDFTIKLKTDVSIAEKGWGDKISLKEWLNE
jgi:DNA polymerase I